MTIRNALAVAGVGLAALAAAPAMAQDRSCDNGRGGLMTDLGFRRLEHGINEGKAPPRPGFHSEPRISGVRRDGPAAGLLLDGDVLAAIDGHAITSPEAERRYASIRAGERVRLSVRRGGALRQVTVTAAMRCIPTPPTPEAPPTPPTPPTPPNPVNPPNPSGELLAVERFGFTLECSNCGDDEITGRFRFREPPIVSEVRSGSAAARAGLRPGDRLSHVDELPLTTDAGWARLSGIRSGQTVRFTYVRGEAGQVTMLAR